MRRNGRIAAALFCALSIGGVLTLFSQAEVNRRSRSDMRSMNLSGPESAVFRSILPAALEGSAARERDDDRGGEAKKDAPRAGSCRLRLH